MGCGRRVAGLDRALWGAEGFVCGLEESLPAPRHAREQLRGEEPITQFGRMCERLGIQLIGASSPQAKGRVERMHGTHQDRLVKKLRRLEIATPAEANAYLEREYLPEHNRRFARAPSRPEDYHGRKPSGRELDQAFRLETVRTISSDWVVRYDSRFLQLLPGKHQHAPAKDRVKVYESRKGELTIEYRGRKGGVGGDPGDGPEPEAGAERTRPAGRRPSPTPAAGGVGAGGRPSLASAGLPGRGTVAPDGRAQGAALAVGLTLRFALSAPPFGLRRASLRASPTASKKRESTAKNKKGTFLTR